MPFRWLEEWSRADAAFEATGENLGEVLRSAWEATLAVMLDDARLPTGLGERELVVRAPTGEELLLALLERIVFVKDAEGLLLQPLELVLSRSADGVELRARARCVPVEAVLDLLRTDVKAVTLHRFALLKVAGGWSATVVLDV